MRSLLRSTVLVLLAIAGGVTAALLVSAFMSREIERRFPPQGRFVDAVDVRFHVLDEGTASDLPAVVLVHGASGNAAEIWGPLRPSLSEHRVLAFDRPGHGYSSRPATWDIRFPSGQAARLVALLDALGIERAVLVGHSWGAALSLSAAIAAPDRVAGLVLAAPASHFWYAGDISWAARLVTLPVLGPLAARTLVSPLGSLLLGPTIGTVFAPDPVPAGYIEESRVPLVLRGAHFRANALDLVNFRAFLSWQMTQYPAVRTPTVILTGDSDGVVKPEIHAQALARQIPGAELWTFPGRGHMIPHVEPRAVARAVARVLERSGEAAP